MKISRWFLVLVSCFFWTFCASAKAEPNVEAWLKSHANIRQSIAWLEPEAVGNGQVLPYEKWDAVRRAALQSAFEKAWNNQPFNLPDPPKNLAEGLSDAYTVLSKKDAWDFYIAGIATSLANEVGKRLPWSVGKYSDDNLQILFHAARIYRWHDLLHGYQIDETQTGSYTPSSPEKILKFLQDIKVVSLQAPQQPQGLPKNTIKAEPLELPNNKPPRFTIPREILKNGVLIRKVQSPRLTAITRLMDWCRYKMIHFSGGFEQSNFLDHWKYSGYPPLSRVIDGTEKNPGQLRHFTAGCHGTVGFLSGVLRQINIPVKYLNICGHGIPYFSSEEFYFTHGDDLYTTFTRQRIYSPYANLDYDELIQKQPLDFPSQEILVSATQFNSWLGSGASDTQKCDNIGRRPFEIAVEFLPSELLYIYCLDKENKLSHEQGTVYQYLKPRYSLTQLESMNFWEKMEKKIAEKGGFGKF